MLLRRCRMRRCRSGKNSSSASLRTTVAKRFEHRPPRAGGRWSQLFDAEVESTHRSFARLRPNVVRERTLPERTAHDDLLSPTPDVEQDGVRGRVGRGSRTVAAASSTGVMTRREAPGGTRRRSDESARCVARRGRDDDPVVTSPLSSPARRSSSHRRRSAPSARRRSAT